MSILRVDGLRFETKRLATGWYAFRLKPSITAERDWRYKPLGAFESESDASSAAFKQWSPKRDAHTEGSK